MKRLLPLLLLALVGCAPSLHGVYYHRVPATSYAVVGKLYLHPVPDTTTAISNYLYPPGAATVVGVLSREWAVIRYLGDRYFVKNLLLAAYRPHAAYGSYGYGSGYGGYGGSGGLALPHDTYIGPRGGEYYYNGNGNKQYVTPPATQYRQDVQYGPRGGQFYYNGSGRKTYIKQ